MPRTGDERSRRELLYQRWTAAQFELAECATPVEIRRKLLEKLTTDDLVLSDECHTALRLATGSSNADSLPYGQADWAEEGRLSTEVENFACEFFSLSPKVREERWQRLRNESTGYAAVQSRLHEFKRGLKIDVAPLATASPDAQTLADGLLRRFCLLAWERAPLRRRELAEHAGDFGRWRKAARELFTQFADIAALDPDLIHELTDTITRKTVSRRVAAREKTTNSSGGSRAIPWVIVSIVVALRFIASFMSDPKPARTPPHIEFPKTWESAFPAGSQMAPGDRRKLYAALANSLGDAPGMSEVLKLEQQLQKDPANDELRKEIAAMHLELARAALQRNDNGQVYHRSKSAAENYRKLSTKESADAASLRNYVTAIAFAMQSLEEDDREREELLPSAWEIAKKLAARGDASVKDQQTADDLLEQMVQLRWSQSKLDQALVLAREAADKSRAEWRKDRKRIDLQDRLDARLAVVSGLLVEFKLNDLALRTASERLALWSGNPARLRKLAIEYVRTGRHRRAAAPKDLVVQREAEEWLVRGLTALQQATAAGLKNLEAVDLDVEWSALRELPAYQKWRSSVPSGKAPEKEL